MGNPDKISGSDSGSENTGANPIDTANSPSESLIFSMFNEEKHLRDEHRKKKEEIKANTPQRIPATPAELSRAPGTLAEAYQILKEEVTAFHRAKDEEARLATGEEYIDRQAHRDSSLASAGVVASGTAQVNDNSPMSIQESYEHYKTVLEEYRQEKKLKNENAPVFIPTVPAMQFSPERMSVSEAYRLVKEEVEALRKEKEAFTAEHVA